MNRRPIATRKTGWAQRAARQLAASRITPNMISVGSIIFAALSFLAFLASAYTGPPLAALLLLVAALSCQLRLICNLLDGMVAIEEGKGEPTGPFWNEAPDRVADLLILSGLGFASGSPVLGLLASALAISTAYLRELGRAEGLTADFCGPMAKPHRMACVTLGCIAGAIEILSFATTWALLAALWILLLGTALTVIRRALRMIAALRALPPRAHSGT